VSTLAIQPVFEATPKTFVPMRDRLGVLNRVIDLHDGQFTDAHLASYIKAEYLNPVFDIGFGSTRSELRFFPPAVDQFISWLNNPNVPWREFTIEDVMARQFPRALRTLGGLAVRGPVVCMSLGCEYKLVIAHIDERHLKQLGQYRRGNGGEAVIEVASIETFLTGRKL